MKVRSVQQFVMPQPVPVYDITVPTFENFTLGNGAVVHNCFVGSTPVLVGNTSKPMIELVADYQQRGITTAGLAFDTTTGKPKAVLLEQPHFTKYVSELTTVVFADCQFECTPDHLWLLTDNSYRRADELVCGDLVRTILPYRYQNAEVVTASTRTLDQPVPVYDLSVRVFNNFALGNGAIVHNSGSAKKARDSNFQEVLSMLGKPPNALKNSLSKLLANGPIQSVLQSLGLVVTAKAIDLTNLRANKIFILSDFDADGPLVGTTRMLSPNGNNTLSVLATHSVLRQPAYAISAAGKVVVTSALHTREICTTTEVVCVTTKLGTVQCTADHKFVVSRTAHGAFLANGNYYAAAQDLVVGDSIKSVKFGPHGSTIANEAIEEIVYTTTVEQPMYCATVPAHGNFVLGNGLVSSNCHISTLLLALIYRLAPTLFEQGRVWIVEAPLFHAMHNNKHFYGESVSAVVAQNPKIRPDMVIRSKGLSELDPEILRRIAFDTTTRSVIQLTMPPKKVDMDYFVSLVGESTAARKKLLGI